jgi:hypothetical protein
MVDYSNPFAPKPIQLPAWMQPGYGSSEPQFVSEGAPLSQTSNAPAKGFTGLTPNSGLYSYPKSAAKAPLANPVTSSVKPSAVAASIKPLNTNSQRYAEEQAAKALGQTYTPGQAAGSAATAAQAAQDAARNGRIDSNLAAVYSPLQDLLKTQQATASKRYAQNQADITSIFGALSSLTAEDTARVNKQFTDSIAKQNTDYATRVAQQNMETQAGVAGAQTAGAERGSGPAMVNNPITAAADAANASANATLTNWQGLMTAEQNQTVKDVENRGAGYTQQKLGALAQLSKNFEDTLSGFAGQDAQIKSQMAQAKIDAQNALASNDFAAAQAADAQASKLQLQDLKNQGLMDVATLKAKVALAKGSGSGKTNLKGVEAIMSKAAAAGVPFDTVQKSVQDAYNMVYNTINDGTSKTKGKPSSAAVKNAWYSLNSGSPQRLGSQTAIASSLIDELFK